MSQTRAARAIRLRLVALIAIAATSRSARALTSTKAIEPPRLRDEVDFAAGDDEPPREDRVALEAKKQRRNRFGLEAVKMRAAPALCPLVGVAPSPLGARHRQRARINLPSRQPMLGGDRRGGVLDREVRELLGDFPVERSLGDRRPRSPPAPTTMTISPLGASSAAYSAASLSSAPRLTSSCSLVNSRATAAGRGPSSSARSASVSASRPGGFVENERAGHGGERVDALPPRRPPGRQETLEKEPVGRQAGDAKRRERRGGARRGDDGEALLDRFGDQLIAGIGNERRSGVGNERQRLPFGDASERARASLGGVVLVVGRERPLNAVAREQRARYAGVFGQDRVGAGQDRKRPQRHVGEVANRRRHNVKTRDRASPPAKSRRR